jgi:hypothetical protein
MHQRDCSVGKSMKHGRLLRIYPPSLSALVILQQSRLEIAVYLVYAATQREVLPMRSYSQDELNSIWQKLKNGTEPNEVFSAHILADTETEQMITLSTMPRPYSDFDNEKTGRSYARKRESKEAVWGMWE